MKNAPDYAKYNQPKLSTTQEEMNNENLTKKEHHGRLVRSNCEMFPDRYTAQEEK